jgi:hypothetical protein
MNLWKRGFLMEGFMTIFEGFFNDFRDFYSRPDRNLTMGGKADRNQVIRYWLLVIAAHYPVSL